jgi:hypothetical protein
VCICETRYLSTIRFVDEGTKTCALWSFVNHPHLFADQPSVATQIEFIYNLDEFRSDRARGRAWIRLACEKKQLATLFEHTIDHHMDVIETLYEPYAFLRDEICAYGMIAHLMGLNSMDIPFFMNHYYYYDGNDDAHKRLPPSSSLSSTSSHRPSCDDDDATSRVVKQSLATATTTTATSPTPSKYRFSNSSSRSLSNSPSLSSSSVLRPS